MKSEIKNIFDCRLLIFDLRFGNRGELGDLASDSAAGMGERGLGREGRGGHSGLGGLTAAGVYLILRVKFPLRVKRGLEEVYLTLSRAVKRDFSISRWTSTPFAVDLMRSKSTGNSTGTGGRGEYKQGGRGAGEQGYVGAGESCKEERVRVGDGEGQKLSCEGGRGAIQVPNSTGRGEIHNQKASEE